MSSASMFELITNPDNLSGNSSFSNLEYESVPSLRTIDDTSFSSGDISFKFVNDSSQWIDPRRMFFKIDVSLTKANGSPLVDADDIAINMGTAALLFDKIDFLLEDKSIDSFNSGTVAITDQILNRLSKSADYLNYGEGQSNNNYNPDFATRQALYSSTNTVYQTGQSLIWYPQLSILRKQKTYLPVGRYEVRLSTHPQFRQRAIESIGANKVNGVDYSFRVNGIELFIPRIRGKRVSDLNFLYDLVNYNVQTVNVKNVTTPQSTKFQVPQNTYMCAIAFQYNKSDTRLSPSKFISTNSSDLFCNSLYANYKGLTKPIPQFNQDYNGVGSDNSFNFRYNYTYSNSEKFNIDCNIHASHESINDYLVRGPFLLIDWTSDSTNKSNVLSVFYQFANLAPADTQIILMTWSRSVVKVGVISDSINSVSIENH